jgi:hypothetical protein
MSTSRPLSSEQHEFTYYTNQRSATNSNCHKLPVEIWRQIFEECAVHIPRALTSSSLLNAPNILDKRKYPYTNIVISHVCRYFRDIALSTPVLWSTLNLDGPQSELKTFLERSKQLPLTITSIQGYPRFYLIRNMASFKAISERIVCIDAPVDGFASDILASCKNLKHVMLKGGMYHHKHHHIERILNDFQFLETIWWTKISNDPVVTSSENKYTLRSLHLSFGVSDASVLSILQSCPVLESVSAHVLGKRDWEHVKDIHLPRLRELHVQCAGEDSWLCRLDVPQVLDHLEYSYCPPSPYISTQEWGISTRSLVLGDYFDFESMVSWLAREPEALNILTLKMEPIKNDMLLTILTANGKRTLCPKLEQVHIQIPLLYKDTKESPDYRRRKDELISYVFSSRKHAGLPPLRFISDGEEAVVKEKAARKNSMNISGMGTNIPNRPSGRVNDIFEYASSMSPVAKGIEWARSKLKWKSKVLK